MQPTLYQITYQKLFLTGTLMGVIITNTVKTSFPDWYTSVGRIYKELGTGNKVKIVQATIKEAV